MSRLFVKICGITRWHDAALAVDLGADALGFVFWPGSPRYVEPENVGAISARLAAEVQKVGVFVNQTVAEVIGIMKTAGLDVAQLHGEESPEYCRELNKRIFKAVRLKNGGPLHIADFDPEVVLLIDAHDVERFGGTGKTVDWNRAREIAGMRPTILSGGLNAANIKEAVRSVRPYGVDVSSGVELSPGIKDPDKLRGFFEALHD